MPLNGKFLDKSGLTYLWSKLKDLFSGKVDKETGKGLSTNDYTTADKTKLSGIETGANNTVVDSAMSSSSTNPVQNRVINTALSGKQNTLTFDSTPTDSSTNPVTSGGVYTDQQRQETEIGIVANAGAKNLVLYDHEAGSQYTTQGRTFTVLSDGGIKIAGNDVTQANADFYLNGLWATTNVIFDLSDKDYYISISDNIGSTVGGIMFRAYNRSTGSTVASYSATLAERQSILKDKITTIFITVTPAVTLPSDGIIVYPMIRRAEITDGTFVPYAPTNRELYETKATVDDIYGVGTIIPDNSDLNNYKTPGSYYVGTSASASTIANIPLGGSGFHLIVRNTSAGNRYRQEFIKLNNPEALYVRHFTTSETWSAWYKFEGTPVTT